MIRSVRERIGLRPLAALAIALLTLGAALPAAAQSPFFSTLRPSPTGNYLAGITALDNLHTELAARYLGQAARDDRNNPVLASRAFLANLAAGDVRTAAGLAQRVLELDPRDDLARLTIAAVALKERRYTSAERTLARMSDGSLVGVTGGITRAWAQLGNGDIDAAFATLDRLGEGGFAEFLVFHRAVMADIGGARSQALELAQEAYELDPFVTRIAEAYIRILGNAGRFEEALAVIDAYADEGLSHPLIEQLRPGIEAGRRPGLFAPNVQAGAAEMFHGLGSALARDGAGELAVVFLRLALYLDPDAAIVSLTLGELLSTAGRYEEANAIYESIADANPLKAAAEIRIAENLDGQGRREEAFERLEAILADRPADLEALGVMGDLLRYDERYEEAAEIYTRLLDAIPGDRPRDWRYYYVRGIAYERAGLWDEAEPNFQRALELNPEQPHVLNYLGYSWVDQGINLEPALAMIERAVQLQPRDGYILDSLGWAFYRLGRIEEAVAELERAVRILPDDPEINDHLGDAYWRAGRQREAMFQWRIAIHVDDRGDVTERARPKLESGLEPPVEAIAAE